MKCKDVQNYRHKCVDAYKLSNGCSICGYNKHPSALCFDHLPDQEKSDVVKNGYSKKSCAGGMFRLYSKKHSINELIGEIEKCRVVCHNCHMEKTHCKNIRSKETTNNISTVEELNELLNIFETQGTI